MGIGIPGLRGGDHLGVTVPDMEQAHACLLYTSDAADE